MSAAVPAENELVELYVDVFIANAMERPIGPALEIREYPMYPWQHHM